MFTSALSAQTDRSGVAGGTLTLPTSAMIRAQLASSPRGAVDELNGGTLEALLNARRYDDVDQLAIAGTIALPRDTWAIEQLQRFRVEALKRSGRVDDALAASKSLFMVAGMGSVAHDIDQICDVLRTGRPEEPSLHHSFREQQLAGAQEDPGVRRIAVAKACESTGGRTILSKVQVDPKPYEDAIRQRLRANDFDGLCALGNLLLLSGRVTEARDVFQRAYDVAPLYEINYASEQLAKVLKAEDLAIGRANAFVKSIRPGAWDKSDGRGAAN
jgi:hypothetical protein